MLHDVMLNAAMMQRGSREAAQHGWLVTRRQGKLCWLLHAHSTYT